MSQFHRKTYDADSITLRTVYARSPENNMPISPLCALTTDGVGGTFWASPSTTQNFTSTVVGLGTAGYISSSELRSTVNGLGIAGYVSSFDLASTFNGLGQIYVSTAAEGVIASDLISTVMGLGTTGYVSTSGLNSTVRGLGTTGYVSTSWLNSTVRGLGTAGYVSSSGLASTVINLGKIGYVSTSWLNSTVRGLGTTGYVSSSWLASTILGLGTFGYLSSPSASAISYSTGVLYTSSINFLDTNAPHSIYRFAVTGGQPLLNETPIGSGDVTRDNLVSSVVGLGTTGYLSSPSALFYSTGSLFTSSISFYDTATHNKQVLAVTSNNILLNGQQIGGGGSGNVFHSCITTLVAANERKGTIYPTLLNIASDPFPYSATFRIFKFKTDGLVPYITDATTSRVLLEYDYWLQLGKYVYTTTAGIVDSNTNKAAITCSTTVAYGDTGGVFTLDNTSPCSVLNAAYPYKDAANTSDWTDGLSNLINIHHTVQMDTSLMTQIAHSNIILVNDVTPIYGEKQTEGDLNYAWSGLDNRPPNTELCNNYYTYSLNNLFITIENK